MQDPLIPVAVVGIAVDDPAQASRVKRVVGIAAFMMLWTVVSQAYMFSLVHSLGGLLSGLAFGGCVPACGYFGAKQRSKPLVGLFTCCNCCAMLSLGSYIVLTVIALAVFNADVNINGEHQSLKHLINTALPEMQACCKQLDACDFEAAGCGAAAAVCHIAALDAEMLPSTDPSTDPACLHQNVTSAAAFSTDNAFLGELDGSSAGTPGVFCVDGNTCKGIDSVDPSFKFSNGERLASSQQTVST
jgi:hypothetical protein